MSLKRARFQLGFQLQKNSLSAWYYGPDIFWALFCKIRSNFDNSFCWALIFIKINQQGDFSIASTCLLKLLKIHMCGLLVIHSFLKNYPCFLFPKLWLDTKMYSVNWIYSCLIWGNNDLFLQHNLCTYNCYRETWTGMGVEIGYWSFVLLLLLWLKYLPHDISKLIFRTYPKNKTTMDGEP